MHITFFTDDHERTSKTFIIEKKNQTCYHLSQNNNHYKNKIRLTRVK